MWGRCAWKALRHRTCYIASGVAPAFPPWNFFLACWYFFLSASKFFLSYKIFFVTNFVTRVTKFVTCVRKFVTCITKFVTNFFKQIVKIICLIVKNISVKVKSFTEIKFHWKGSRGMSSGVVPSRHIVLGKPNRALRTRLPSLRSVVPSRHFAPQGKKDYSPPQPLPLLSLLSSK